LHVSAPCEFTSVPGEKSWAVWRKTDVCGTGHNFE
jgi:hypothetical protein